MAKYTTEVRSICESLAGYVEGKGSNDVNEVISKSRAKIFNFDYPIFDNSYKSVIETKILKHYYGREIGAETFGRWQLWLDARMNEIMPYYNKLYQSELLTFNPLYDVDYTRTGEKEGTNTGTITTDNDGTLTRTDNTTQTTNRSSAPKNQRWEEYSDTPQGELTGVRNMTYLTEARHITDDGTGSTETGTVANTGTTTNLVDTTEEQERNLANTEEYLEHIVGKMSGGSYSKMLEEYRKTFLNIDMLVIKELKDLFMGLW